MLEIVEPKKTFSAKETKILHESYGVGVLRGAKTFTPAIFNNLCAYHGLCPHSVEKLTKKWIERNIKGKRIRKIESAFPDEEIYQLI